MEGVARMGAEGDGSGATGLVGLLSSFIPQMGQRALLSAGQRDDLLPVPHLERSEQADLHPDGCNTEDNWLQGERAVRAV